MSENDCVPHFRSRRKEWLCRNHLAWLPPLPIDVDQRGRVSLALVVCPQPVVPATKRNRRKEGVMSGTTLSVSALFAERDARRRHDQESAEHLQQRKEEELAEFRKRLDNFQLTDAIIHSGLDRIRRAFERGETELMIASFPSSFCTDGGRAIINAGAPPINKPSQAELAARS